MVTAASGEAGEGAARGGGTAVGVEALARGKKNARRRRAWIVFQDESGVSQRPAVRRTWAPKGETPVLVHAFNWKKLSIAAALAFSWDGSRSRLFFQTKPDNYNAESLIGFLQDLRRELRGRPCILVWDGLPAHKSRDMTAFLATQSSWLRIEMLPGYSPDLNPVETLWGNVKGLELANLCPDDLTEVADALRRGMARVAARQEYARVFLAHAGLSF
jgi:transposase